MKDQRESVENPIQHISLDEASFLKRSPEIEMERHKAVSDLLVENNFILIAPEMPPPYDIHLSLMEHNICVKISNRGIDKTEQIQVSSRVFKTIIKDYFAICENYYEFARQGDYAKLEAVDMGRRGIHNEGADILINYLKNKIILDKSTARRLFTLICILHIRIMPH